ncbi:MAG: hypothetical protein RL204_56 [Bacteroidota bacterium]|jgi:hypothetical protein
MILFQEYLIPGNLKGLRFHELKRTFGSYQALVRLSLAVIGRSIRHKLINNDLLPPKC